MFGLDYPCVLREPGWRWESLELVEGGTRLPKFSEYIDRPRQWFGAQHEGANELLWSPEHPRLLDVVVTVESPEIDRDVVASYLGLRSAAVAGGWFNLNDRPYYVRSVLNQGYWPESHLASPSAAALRREVELIKELGFNATRVHRKIEDPASWADRLGLLTADRKPKLPIERLRALVSGTRTR